MTVAIGQVVNRWSVVSYMPVLQMMHSVIAGHPFLFSTSAVWILFCRSSQMNTLIFGGTWIRQILCRVGLWYSRIVKEFIC
jgi:hypothetical protein